MSKYVRVMDNNVSNESGLEFKIGEVVESRDWDPFALERDDIKGICFSNEENILRWIRRGDTLYDVEVPFDGQIKQVPGTFTPNGLFRANKVIVSNPRVLTDDLCLELYFKSDMPEDTYPDVLAILAIKGFNKTCMQLIKDRVRDNNVDKFVDTYIKFVTDVSESDLEPYNNYKDFLVDLKQKIKIKK